MAKRRSWAMTGAVLFLVCFAAGCAKGHISYPPNATLYKIPRYEKTVVVKEFKDLRPIMENDYFSRSATSDLHCSENVADAVALAVKNDLAKSGLFAKVVSPSREEEAANADIIIEGELRHLYGRYQEKWLKFPAALGLVIAAPYYVPYEKADFNLEVHLRAIDAKDQSVLWERTLERQWTYGPMTAMEFCNHYGFLYEKLRERLQKQVAAGIRDLDVTLANCWYGAAL